MSSMAQFKPLYQQVYDVLAQRLADNYWPLHQAIPSEFGLAAELGVSQGTVRKALNLMVDENLLERRQGKGTFVARHTQERSLFRFFRLRESDGERLIPTTELIKVRRRKATAKEASRFELADSLKVVEMTRLRRLNNHPVVYEKIIQPLAIFPDIDKRNEIPNALYALYQSEYGVSIASVNDQITAVPCTKTAAKFLGSKVGDAVLNIKRASFSIDGKMVEWSEAICQTKRFVYYVDLR